MATQPIIVDDVLAYLLAASQSPSSESRTFEVGSTEIVTYSDLIREYARQKGLHRRPIFVPILLPTYGPPALVTTPTYEVGRNLIKGLKPPVNRDKKAVVPSWFDRWV